MKNIELKHSMNYTESDIQKSVNDQASEAVPGQSYSVREILEKFTRGNAPAVSHAGMYDPDDNLEEMDVLDNHGNDISDIMEAGKRIEKTLTELQQKKAKRKNEKTLAEIQAKVKKQIEADITAEKTKSDTIKNSEAEINEV